MISNSELKQRLKNIKLVVTDVDGTLTNEYNAIGETTKKLVPKLRERGIMFSFATQRIHSSIVDYAKELNLELPIMTINGALIRDLKGNDISKSVIPQKKVIKALNLASKYFVRIALCYNDEIIYTEDNSVLKDFLFRLGANYHLVESYEKYTDQVLEIIMLGNEKRVIKHIQRKMNFPNKFFLTARYYRSSRSMGVYHLEIRKSGTTKKEGLKKLAKYLKLKKSEIAVIGDWYNDRDLFEYGGLNIALQNTVPELKNKAHYITKCSNNEDGVGEFLQLLDEVTT